MDATLKRRMWKAAIAHFALTVLIGGVFLNFGITTFAVNGPPEILIRAQSHFDLITLWFRFFVPILFFLQPQLWLLTKVDHLHVVPVGMVFPFIIVLIFSIPFWSLCFGWLFAKFDNWLNHFPVLGRKVF